MNEANYLSKPISGETNCAKGHSDQRLVMPRLDGCDRQMLEDVFEHFKIVPPRCFSRSKLAEYPAMMTRLNNLLDAVERHNDELSGQTPNNTNR